MNSEDKIREKFQSKFSNFELPVPDDGWKRLEESLNNISVTKKLVVRRRWQYAGSAAAILVLIIGGLFYINKPTAIEPPLMSDSSNPAIETELPFEVNPQRELEVTGAPLLAESKFEKKTSLHKTNRSDLIATNIDNKSQQEDDNLFVLNHDLTVTENNSYTDVVENIVEEREVFNLIEDPVIVEVDNNLLYADNNAKVEDGDYVLSFGGKGGLTSFHQTVNSPMTLRSAAVSGTTSFPEGVDKNLLSANNSRDNIAEMEHDQPVSFGLTVSKLITDNLYIESGLIYSYLYSRSKNTGTATQNRQTQSLHYLGVPLNLNYNLFSIKDMNVYVSLGGMIEKDVYGKFKEVGESQSLESQNNSEVLINETISQKNPQLSVNAGVGLSYPIYRDLKIYGKIGGAYYFDAENYYKTIYSDRKIVMDISLGIRYEF